MAYKPLFFETLSPAQAEEFLRDVYVPWIPERYQQLQQELRSVGVPAPGLDDDSLTALWVWFDSTYVKLGEFPFAETGVSLEPPVWTDGYFPDVENREVRALMTGFGSAMHLRLQQKHGSDIYSVHERGMSPQLGRNSSSFRTPFVEGSMIGLAGRAMADEPDRRPSPRALVETSERFGAQVANFSDGAPSLEPSKPQVVFAGEENDLDGLAAGHVEIAFDELTPRGRRRKFSLLLRSREELRGVSHNEDDLGYIVASFNVEPEQVRSVVTELWDQSA